MSTRRTVVSIIILVFSLLTLNAWASSADAIKQRMLERLPVINTLKNQGIIGEDSDGYLQYRGSEQPQKDLINAENQDREAVYEAIAKKEGAKLLLVGQRRAQQILELGKTGHWYRKSDGTWYKK